MEKKLFIIWMLFLLSCSNDLKTIEPEVKYIDYSTCPQEGLTTIDKILLENVNFEEGQLGTSLNLTSALKLGIPETKYNYFLEYLQNENQKMEKYLDAGGIVFYNGEAFTRNKELYQYIKNKEQSLSRVNYDQASRIAYEKFHSNSPERIIHFKGPSMVSVNASRDVGSFTLEEESKRLSIYLARTEHATFKWGFGDNVQWDWKIKYHSSGYFDSNELAFYGYWEEPMPVFPDGDTYNKNMWLNHMPTYVKIWHNKIDNNVKISIEQSNGLKHIASVYKKVGKEYKLYHSSLEFEPFTYAYVNTPLECTFWLVIYKVFTKDGKTTYDLLGDMEIVYDGHW